VRRQRKGRRGFTSGSADNVSPQFADLGGVDELVG